jgi:hypothetical protein
MLLFFGRLPEINLATDQSADCCVGYKRLAARIFSFPWPDNVISLSSDRGKKAKRDIRGYMMNDQMFVETLLISSSFFTIAMIIVISVMLLEKYR